MGENAFRRSCNFKELRVVKRAHITTCALCAWWQPSYRIGRTNISTWQRPTELFRTRLIHHSRSWLHLQLHRFGYPLSKKRTFAKWTVESCLLNGQRAAFPEFPQGRAGVLASAL